MTSIADLLDLIPTDQVGKTEHLNETVETLQNWRRAGAIPAEKIREVLDLAILQGHLLEVSEAAAKMAPAYAEAAFILHDLGKLGTRFQHETATGRPTSELDALPASKGQQSFPITRILEEMQEHRVFFGDPVTRVRALRAEWEWREELHDRIRCGDVD